MIENNGLERELVLSSMNDTLTEARYNEILDALLPSIEVPDAIAMLEGFGEPDWRKRRFANHHASSAVA
jgi:hypothetical protein